MNLTRHQMALLTVARRMTGWTPAVADRRIREAFDMDPLEFLQEVAAVIALPAAEAFDPQTVRRLRRTTKHRSRLA